ncbi:sensor histidine kinase [Austwickia chelonae]|uniref:sensor histidine kinase n=1 Tax=Austwickia chelonae TaxID=100225 RepID=UPI000E27A84F|nr:histidine kinase [Austwickia chelonae]
MIDTGGHPPSRTRSQLFLDAALVLVAAVFVAAPVLDGSTTGQQPTVAMLGLGGGLAGALSLWWRRRYPTGVALGLTPLLLFTDSLGPAALVALYTLAVASRLATTLGVVSLHLVVTACYLSGAFPPDKALDELTVGIASTIGAVALGRLARSRRELLESLRARVLASETELEARVTQAQLAERERIARDMHDQLAHRLSLVVMYANILDTRKDLTDEESTQAMQLLRASAQQSMEDLRAVLGLLRSPEETASNSSVRAVPQLIDQARRSGATVKTVGDLSLMTQDGLVGLTAYRVVQEGLTNARKHAPGAPVTVEIRRDDKGLLVRVLTPLPSSAPLLAPRSVQGGHWGLIGLGERVRLIGGRFRSGPVSSAEGKVFVVEAHLPCQP